MRLRILAGIAGAVLIAGCGRGPADDTTLEESDSPRYTAENFSSRTSAAWLRLKTAHMTLSLGSGSAAFKADGVVSNGPTAKTSAFRVKYEVADLSFEVRAVKGIFYVNYGELTHGKFVAIDPEDESNELSRLFAAVVENMDLASSVRSFSGAISRLKRSGKPIVLDGVSTTPYAVTIDTDKMKASHLLDNVPEGVIPATLNYVFYMAADGAPRRVTYSFEGSEKFVMNFTKVGEPVDIVAPDKSEQIDQSILTNRQKTA